jgi:hypothetical protein
MIDPIESREAAPPEQKAEMLTSLRRKRAELRALTNFTPVLSAGYSVVYLAHQKSPLEGNERGVAKV